MSISTAITTAQNRVAAAYTACNSKGATMPSTQNLSNLATTINSIETSVPVNQTIEKWNGTSTYTRSQETSTSNITAITANKFDGDTSIVSVLLPSTVTTINDYAFRSCTNLKYVNLENITTFGMYSFADTGMDCGIHIKNVSQMKNYAFNNSSIYSLEVDAVSSRNAFSGNNLFSNCANLISVILPNNCNVANYMFQNCSKLESVTFGTGIQQIGASAFANCTKLAIVLNFPNLTSIQNSFTSSGITGIESLGSITSFPYNSTFQSCTSLTYVKLPSTITNLGNYAFRNCTALTTVYVYATTPPTYGTSPFGGCTALTSIYVPSASVSAYKSATGWSAHASIIKSM